MRTILFLLTFFISFSAFASDVKHPVIGNKELMEQIKAHDTKTMVIFWAPWCPFCVRELKIIRDNPNFVKFNNLQIIGLNKNSDRHTSIRYAAKENLPFRFFTAKSEIYDKYQKIDAVPLTIVFSNEGKILDLEYGKQDIEDLALMLED